VSRTTIDKVLSRADAKPLSRARLNWKQSSRYAEDVPGEWQDHHNHFRSHGSLGGLTPWESWQELARITPWWDDVEANYDPAKERIRHPDYRIDTQLQKIENRQENRFLERGAAPEPPRFIASSQDSRGKTGASRSR
jgi:hypothetical protein